ncbi:hypothetical protein Q8F55_002790 [Vanrija albida]|uniref:Arrestin-like N-terminal domain-containing protein n=1 Tax=Vanrija albida TaxID=181172 RepID=A0ABR3QAV4_9TREE
MWGYNDPLAAHVQVEFATGVVDLIGSAQTGTSYSLPGTAYLVFAALPSLERQRLVRDLTITLEAKSEYFDDHGRYTPMRLHTAVFDLLASPLQVPPSDSGRTLTLAVPFDLRVPGWLPSSYNSVLSATSFGVVATATVCWPRGRLLDAPARASTSPYTPFLVRRHRMPTAISPDAPVRMRAHHVRHDGPLDATFHVPEWVDIHGGERSLRVSVLLRVPEDSEADDVLINEIGMEVEEADRFCSTRLPNYGLSFPIPLEQPTRFGRQHALLSRSPRADAPQLGDTDLPIRAIVKRACLLSDEGLQRNFCFGVPGLRIGRKWRKVNVILPLPDASSPAAPHGDYDGPFVRRTHVLRTTLKYRLPSGDVLPVTFAAPIRFATSPHTMPSSTAAPPAYIQVFEENGELRDCDPLPLYLPPPGPAPGYASPQSDWRELPPLAGPAFQASVASPTPVPTDLPSSPNQSDESMAPEPASEPRSSVDDVRAPAVKMSIAHLLAPTAAGSSRLEVE